MKMNIALFLTDAILINVVFVLTFLIRYGLPFPENNFLPYKNSFVFLTLIYILILSFFGAYKKRFKSSWELIQKVSLSVFLGTLLSVAFVYVFRAKWGAFPTSVFAISFLVNLLLIFKVNQFILKAKKRIKKQVIILGEGKVDDIVGKKANVERKRISQIGELLEYSDVDEIVVSEKISDAKNLNLLLYLQRKLKAEILFSPAVYMGLLPERINGNSSIELLSTFVGRRSELDEFFITSLDTSTSLILLILAAVPMSIISILIKITSSGTIIYKQQRVGKDGKIFTLYKFRTMVKDAEKKIGPVLAKQDDPRITKIGKVLRRTRMDELPQLFNVLCGQMSLVGPRPERPHFVKLHKALHGLRLAVKPGLTGLAQIRNFYDLQPTHKIKYDFLYIQRRSLWLNIYILLQTIPVIFSKKGW
ncbi:MAG: sugar transferase [Planctomycetota bacterium]|jgi:lipopolysaccharide/colanic/teichoic acid biosynthesis glycosyltransferase